MSRDEDALWAELDAALRARAPRPEAGRREADLAAARESFARLHAAGRGGPLARARGWLAALWGRVPGRGGLVAGTALVACGAVVLSPAGREMLRAPWEREAVTAEPREAQTAEPRPAQTAAAPVVPDGEGGAGPEDVAPAPEGVPEGGDEARLRAGPEAPAPEGPEAAGRRAEAATAAKPAPEMAEATMAAEADAPGRAEAVEAIEAPAPAPAPPAPPAVTPEGAAEGSEDGAAEPLAQAAPSAGAASSGLGATAEGAGPGEGSGGRAARAPGPAGDVGLPDALDGEGVVPGDGASPGTDLRAMASADVAVRGEAPAVAAVRRALEGGALPATGSVAAGEVVAALALGGGAGEPGLAGLSPLAVPAPWDAGRLLVVVAPRGEAGARLDWGPGVVEWRRLGETAWRARAAEPGDRLAPGTASLWEARVEGPGAGSGPVGTLRAGALTLAFGGRGDGPGAEGAEPDGSARWAAAVAGWAALLDGADLGPWGFDEALALGLASGAAARPEGLALMRLSAGVGR